MAFTLELPQVGESVVEGIIGKWLKQPGDKLEKYDPLVEVVTDKVTMEVPSPVTGVLSRILVEEGVTVPMGAPIAEIETDEVVPGSTQASRQAPAPAAPQQASTTGYLVKGVEPVGPTGGGVGDPTTPESPSGPASVSPAIQESGRERGRHSPAVRRLADDHNVDLSRVTGTGMGGRITREDILSYIDLAPAATKAPPVAAGPEDEARPLSPIRHIIAQNMVKSATEIPHAWSMVEVDVSSLVKYRNSLKEEFRQREGVALTYLAFVIKAVVESLKEHPLLNSTWGGDKVILKKGLHVGIAVATPEGLVVPVIHNAGSLGIAALAVAAQELTGKARQGKLALEDVQRGTFTLNNTGALGSIVSQPLINYPQAAILTTEAIQKRPVVLDDAIAVRSMMNICLSFDHRIIDGAVSGAFLQSVKDHLEAMGPDAPVY